MTRARCVSVVISGGSLPGAMIASGCRLNVTTIGVALSSPAFSITVFISAWWPRWTPSNTPIDTTHGRTPGGTSPSPW